jgi:hypothetical protein
MITNLRTLHTNPPKSRHSFTRERERWHQCGRSQDHGVNLSTQPDILNTDRCPCMHALTSVVGRDRWHRLGDLPSLDVNHSDLMNSKVSSRKRTPSTQKGRFLPHGTTVCRRHVEANTAPVRMRQSAKCHVHSNISIRRTEEHRTVLSSSLTANIVSPAKATCRGLRE